ncbi:hypothetical protein HYU21_04085 [Candidatus Woesearchaeota archaeon]|nr:hypothetical protein [Candidatus Woesearchaeota archaeon]
MNKKGIMIDFLVTILLAIIIFAPACYFLGKMFTFSEQAKDSFFDLTKEIKSFAKDQKKTETSQLLILDEGSFVALFKDQEKQLIYSTEEFQNPGGEIVETADMDLVEVSGYYFAYPVQSCTQLPCACLCRKISDESYNKAKDLNCESLTCQSLPEVKLQSSWSMYRIKDAIIEEGTKLRRNSLKLTKINGEIKIENSNTAQQ